MRGAGYRRAMDGWVRRAKTRGGIPRRTDCDLATGLGYDRAPDSRRTILDTQRLTLLALPVLLMMGRSALADVTVPATLAADESWTAAAGPYLVETDVTVPEDVTLAVGPGVRIVLSAGRSLIVRGQLVARGTEADPIVFDGADAGDGKVQRWGSVVFEDSSTDAVLAAGEVYQSGSILEHCVLKNGTRGVKLNAASPFLHLSTFQGNHYKSASTTDPIGGAAVYVGKDSTPWIVGCRFIDNSIEGAAPGGAVCVDYGDPIVKDNLFQGNSAIYGAGLATNFQASPIVGNTFTGNQSTWEAGAVALVSSQPAFLNNTVTDNTANADGAGLHVCTTCYPHADPLVMDNTITGNATQIEGAGGVGGAYIRVFAWNNVHGNTRADEPADFGWFNVGRGTDPDWAVDLSVANNWWGTTDAAAIDATIEDGNDDAAYGKVSWAPALTGPVTAPTPRVTITTRHIVYEQDGIPMPVYLTLYNPGAAREVVLHVMLQYGTGAPAFFRGSIGLDGAVRDGDGFRVTLPTNSVHFATLVTPTFTAGATRLEATLHAVMSDAATGARIGDACSTRFDLAAGGDE